MIRALSILALSTILIFQSAVGYAEGRFDQYSVQPFDELEPGFTTDPRQVFVLKLTGVGREPLVVLSVSINGREIPQASWTIKLNTLRIAPSDNLRVGLNRVTVRYSHPVDRAHAKRDDPVVHTFFVNYQQSKASILLGARGEMIVGGVPRFIRAGFRSGQVDAFEDALPSAAQAGFDMVHDYRFEVFNLESGGAEFVKEARKYLQRARELDLGVFLGLPRAAVREYNEPLLAFIISELANESSLWMWYIYDEPHAAVLSVRSASRTYDLLRRLDPGRPSVLLTNRIETMYEYYPFCDVLWFDRYPIVATSRELSSLAPIAAAMDRSVSTLAARKPLWPVLQVHDNAGRSLLRKRVPYLSKPTDATHRPTEEQIRAQTHISIASGLMAVVYYWAPETWYSMGTDTPNVWRSLSRVLREIRQLEPILLSEDSPPDIEIVGGHDKVMTWRRRRGDSIYLGLVNSASRSPASMFISKLSDAHRVQKLFGDGRMTHGVDGGSIVELNPAGVVVLVFSPK